MSGFPPRSPASAAASASASSSSCINASSGSNKTPKTSRSDSPSASATNDHGRSVVEQRLRSVLSHPLALPLCSMLNGNAPGSLSYLARESKFHKENTEPPSAAFDTIFSNAVEEWVASHPTTGRDEPQLTKLMSDKIEEEFNRTGFHSDAEVGVDCAEEVSNSGNSRIDILLAPQPKDSETPSTPFALIEVGRKDLDWWKKLDQNIKYLDKLGDRQRDKRLRFEKPLLCAVLTIEGEGSGEHLKVKLGVFLCSPKGPSDSRFTLLWHFKTTSLEEASKGFGKLLRATSDFSSWRESEKAPNYEYFSSNCCRVGKDVLRSYDSRFRPTNRSSEIYLSLECRDIVVGTTTEVLVVEGDADGPEEPPSRSHYYNHSFWVKSDARALLVIATPYRLGGHVAKKPKAFLPIIDQLQKLHATEFVHGDIRAFNTVFGEQEDQGWLIDFDFGGKLGTGTRYPKGYRNHLADGDRMGDGEDQSEILKWHDWFALCRLIFEIHRLKPPDGQDEAQLMRPRARIADMAELWEFRDTDPPLEEIAKLKNMLCHLDEHGWTVRPRPIFKKELEKTTQAGAGS